MVIIKRDMEIAVDNLLDKIKGNECLYSSSKRKDCEKAVGVPKDKYKKNYDKNGRPVGWCEVCWGKYKIKQLLKQIKELNAEIQFGRMLNSLQNFESELEEVKNDSI